MLLLLLVVVVVVGLHWVTHWQLRRWQVYEAGPAGHRRNIMLPPLLLLQLQHRHAGGGGNASTACALLLLPSAPQDSCWLLLL